MAHSAADAKSALLAEELKEFALTLPATVFPKNFSCTTCNELAFDSWKLLCCNKAVCSLCHAKLEFPTTCPSCDHTPLEAESCAPNKSLRNTMRVWLQKQKKKEEAKTTVKVATPPTEEVSEVTDAQIMGDSADRPVESIEKATRPEDFADNQATTAGEDGGEATERAGSSATQHNETPLAPQADDAGQCESSQSQNPKPSADPTSATQDQNPMQTTTEETARNPTMANANAMSGQFGFGFAPNQGNFNGMGWNGMGPMNGMNNMMPNGNWNNINSMDFNMMNNMNGMANMPNGMYNNFGGNMGMGMAGMNDMSAMNMNFGGGYGNWGQGTNGAGYANFTGYNQMGGYNQSGAQYPEMMNQFPKNNFSTQNRFQANGAAFSQQRNNRNGSFGGHSNQPNNQGAAFPQKVNSRPGSRGGLPHNRDDQTPNEEVAAATEIKDKDEHAHSSPVLPQEGNCNVDGNPMSSTSLNTHEEGPPSADVTKDPDELTQAVGDESNNALQTSGLNPIQTVDSIILEHAAPYDGSMIMDNIPPEGFQGSGMMNDYSNQMPHLNGIYDQNMGFNQNNYGPRGGFNPAYGAATVLVGEPRGLGVEGAPTGPRAMREGRPNTGFSSRANNPRSISNAPGANVLPTQETAPGSPPRRGRSSPERDETLRTKNKSPTRSRSRDRDGEIQLERVRSVEGGEKRDHGDRGATPTGDDYERGRKEGRRHRSSRYDDRDDRDTRDGEYDDRYRNERDDREDRARSTSADSKYRSRRDKEKHRSSRSHRDRSREHRHRYRSRSRSPIAEDADGTGVELGARRKSRSEKEKHRDRDSDRSRDKDRDRDRRDRRERDYDHEHDYERKKDRAREKDRDRKRSRRDRGANEIEERDYVDDKHRSSRRSRKDRDREQDRGRETEPKSCTSTRSTSPPINAPTGPSADGFSIRGVSKTKKEEKPTTKPMPPPTGPRALQPPKGPAADRRDSRDHRRKSSVASVPTTPTTPSGSSTTQDHYAAEREKNARERDRLDRDKLLHSVHERATNSRSGSISASISASTSKPPSKPASGSAKRARDTDDAPATATAAIPTGPSSHRSKRRKSDLNSDNVANLFAAGLRKHASVRERRRGGVKTEGSVERELERTEREREGGRR